MLPAAASFIIVVTAFVTSVISGVFGMAGGLLLMGLLAMLLPVAAAFFIHGAIQIVANGWRALLHRHHIDGAILVRIGMGSAAAGALVGLVSYIPSRPLLYLLLGLVPTLVWVPGSWLRLDAARPAHALAAGFLVTATNLLAGVAGPLLDLFFVRTGMGRHRIVATKAATQVLSHLAKLVVFGTFIVRDDSWRALPLWLLPAVIPLTILGTIAGGVVLNRLSDQSFLAWTRWIVTLIGLFYLSQAARLAWT